MIELRNITKSFPVRGTVLDSLEFRAAPGASVAITGPSGSGKTTLLNIIGLLEKPDGGLVISRDENITGLRGEEAAKWRNKNIGFIFQEHLLLPHLTVQENICLPLLATDGSGRSIDKAGDYIRQLAERTGISDILGKYPHTISGGEAQRAAFVRALVNRPALLLADEPTGSLDRANAQVLAELLASLNKEFKTTLIVVTHSEHLAAAMDIRYELLNGKLIQTEK